MASAGFILAAQLNARRLSFDNATQKPSSQIELDLRWQSWFFQRPED